MVRIPIVGDVAELVGAAAEKVENRSLLLDKFVFHKRWPVVSDSHNRDVNEASRWSLMRIAHGASDLLNRDANEKRRKAQGQNVEDDNRERFIAEAEVAEALARISWDTKELAAMRAKHTRRFLGLFRSAYGERASVVIGQLEGRLAINLADSLIPNAGICLDRLFGSPYIPGSAVKGICRHAALEQLKAAQGAELATLFEDFRTAFGTAGNDFIKNGDLCAYRDLLVDRAADQRGSICFLPAYPVGEARVIVDLTNVHYPDYYQTGRAEDLAKERPRPNSFPAVEAGSQFAFCLLLNCANADKVILYSALRWLEAALTVLGLGAKTASGYGWFSLRPEVLEQLLAEELRESEAAEARAKEQVEVQRRMKSEELRKAALNPIERTKEDLLRMNDETFAEFAKAIGQKTPDEQHAFILILRREKRDRWKTWKKKKPELAKAIDETRAKLEIPPLP